MTPTPASVAARLTEAQKRAVLNAGHSSLRPGHLGVTLPTCVNLRRRGVFWTGSNRIGQPTYALTPFGLAVRALLQEQINDR